MFPNLDREFLQSSLSGRNLLEAVTFLVGGDCSDPPLPQVGHSSSSTPSTSSLSDTYSSLSELLEYFSSSVIDDYDSWITTEKDKVWSRAVQFYKTTKVKEKRLRGRVCIEYVDDDGVDAGALRGDFFEKLMTALNEKLFEGDDFRKLPKKDGGMEQLFEIGGMMVAHSVIQGGPSLSCINPALYHYMMTDNVEQSIMMYPLQVSNIPLNAGTADLINLIQQVGVVYINIIIGLFVTYKIIGKRTINQHCMWPIFLDKITQCNLKPCPNHIFCYISKFSLKKLFVVRKFIIGKHCFNILTVLGYSIHRNGQLYPIPNVCNVFCHMHVTDHFLDCRKLNLTCKKITVPMLVQLT